MATAALPDGRELVATQGSPTDDWVVCISGEEQHVATGRWLLSVVSDLLGLPRGTKPAWVHKAVEQLSGRDTPLGRRYPCPCCDYLTLEEPPTGTYQICPVCRWEDDNIQYADLDYRGGANKVSLNEARENVRRYGTSDLNRRGAVRPPLPEERP